MKKIVVDILMFILMLLEFSRMYMSPLLHEIIGIILTILFITHIVLNRNYIKAIFKGKYTLSRTIIFIVNILFMISFVLTILFGILSSEELLKIFSIKNLNIIRLHKTISYINLIILGFHLGINFTSMLGKVTKMIKNKIVLLIISILIIIYGIYSFIKVDFCNHLIGKYGFGIVEENIIVNTLEYLSVVLMITIICNYCYKK